MFQLVSHSMDLFMAAAGLLHEESVEQLCGSAAQGMTSKSTVCLVAY